MQFFRTLHGTALFAVFFLVGADENDLLIFLADVLHSAYTIKKKTRARNGGRSVGGGILGGRQNDRLGGDTGTLLERFSPPERASGLGAEQEDGFQERELVALGRPAVMARAIEGQSDLVRRRILEHGRVRRDWLAELHHLAAQFLRIFRVRQIDPERAILVGSVENEAGIPMIDHVLTSEPTLKEKRPGVNPGRILFSS